MFTGLVETTGTITDINRNRIAVETGLASELNIGDSIAVNGACLTVTRLESNTFIADTSPETYSVTSFRTKKKGDIVKGIHQLFDIVLQRNNQYKEAANPDEIISTFKEIFIVITSIDDLLGAYDEKTNEMLELILEKGKSVYQINILVAETAKNIGSLSYTSWFKENANTQNVIWYGSGLADQYIFDLNSKGSDLHSKLPDMFGFVVQNGNYTKVKLITQKNESE